MGRFSLKGHINIFIKFNDFVVYFGKNIQLYVEIVTFDENFLLQILP